MFDPQACHCADALHNEVSHATSMHNASNGHAIWPRHQIKHKGCSAADLGVHVTWSLQHLSQCLLEHAPVTYDDLHGIGCYDSNTLKAGSSNKDLFAPTSTLTMSAYVS